MAKAEVQRAVAAPREAGGDNLYRPSLGVGLGNSHLLLGMMLMGHGQAGRETEAEFRGPWRSSRKRSTTFLTEPRTWLGRTASSSASCPGE